MSTISAGTATGTALVSTGDTTGQLVLQTNGTTTALTLNTAQAIGVGSTPSFGSSGQVLTSAGSGAPPTWATPVSSISRSDRTSNTILGTADRGNLINITSGTFTQTFTAAATLGSGWFCYISNAGTGFITLDPNASETIDGLTSYVMYPGEVRLVQCNGTNFITAVLEGFSFTTDSTITFTKPPGYAGFAGYLWGGGGSGGKRAQAGGGGGGACVPFNFEASRFPASLTITIGAGGAGQTSSSSDGQVGGTSTLGSLVTAYGGGGGQGASVSSGPGGSGGGLLAAGSTGTSSPVAGGGPLVVTFTGGTAGAETQIYGGGQGKTSYNATPQSIFGGAGGGGGSAQGSNAIYGGGGGGAGIGGAAGGTSTYGGNGGAGSGGSSGTAGSTPGGGGGGTESGATSGAGGSGRCIIWGM